MERREFLKGVIFLTILSMGEKERVKKEGGSGMKLGLVTYNLARDWDLETIIRRCKATKFEGVELRTTHAHGVEPSIGQEKRKDVRRIFEESGVKLWGLGTVCEFHSPDPNVLKKNIDICKEFVILARDVGAVGVKVRPNAIPAGVPEEKTLEQIGRALRECGMFASGEGVEIWLEVHGSGTSHPPRIRRIMEICDHPSVGVCWNSNDTDVKDGSVKEYFQLLAPYVKSVHINELWREEYPWRELFSLLKGIGYDRFTLAEIPESPDPERLMRYYRALWIELTR